MNWKQQIFLSDTKPISSMDDLSLYGPRTSSFSHKEAVSEGVIVPSKFIVCEGEPSQVIKDWVESKEDVLLENDLGEQTMLSTEGRKAYALMCLGARMGLDELFTIKSNLKVLSFHTRITDAERAIDVNHPLTIIPESIKDKVWVKVYHSELSVNQRRQVLKEFNNHEGPAILTCVRAIREGINIPSIDCTVHMRAYGAEDDQGVSVEFIQHIGRGSRLGKDCCWHVIPIPAAGFADGFRKKIIAQVFEILEQYEILPELLTILQNHKKITSGALVRNGVSVKASSLMLESDLIKEIQLQIVNYVRGTDIALYAALSAQEIIDYIDQL